MVAEDRPDLAAGGGGLPLQAHDEIDDLDAGRTTITEVAHEPEARCATDPGGMLVNKALFGKQNAKAVEMTVDIAYYIDGSGRLRRWWHSEPS
ncbi:MAG: hypothetical protein NVS4B8_15650 [Herpetosiphon sp.]